ncbi:hypothetical protein GVN20_18355 [Runella sp. CRIBMP]|uniref:hypothetical protein n=1 Tax=Runella sp. CRIBMP TaxID=2683261 RepID=UPI001411C230|nr:hypothetical protein [Runella sp. CRIBMP]NBB21334.1 hypothetical protein [Runella sp. CRIBMP]
MTQAVSIRSRGGFLFISSLIFSIISWTKVANKIVQLTTGILQLTDKINPQGKKNVAEVLKTGNVDYLF